MNYCVEGIVVLILLNTSKKCTHTYFRQKNIVLACDKIEVLTEKKISSQFFCVWGERWKMHFLKSFFLLLFESSWWVRFVCLAKKVNFIFVCKRRFFLTLTEINFHMKIFGVLVTKTGWRKIVMKMKFLQLKNTVFLRIFAFIWLE